MARVLIRCRVYGLLAEILPAPRRIHERPICCHPRDCAAGRQQCAGRISVYALTRSTRPLCGRQGGICLVPDDFQYEQPRPVKGRGLVVMTSCGRRGIVVPVRTDIKVSGVEKVHAMPEKFIRSSTCTRFTFGA